MIKHNKSHTGKHKSIPSLLLKIDQLEQKLALMSTAAKTLPMLILISFLTLGGTVITSFQAIDVSNISLLPVTGDDSQIASITYNPDDTIFPPAQNSSINLEIESETEITDGKMVFTYDPSVIAINKFYIYDSNFEITQEILTESGKATVRFTETTSTNNISNPFLKISFVALKNGPLNLQLDEEGSELLDNNSGSIEIEETTVPYEIKN